MAVMVKRSEHAAAVVALNERNASVSRTRDVRSPAYHTEPAVAQNIHSAPPRAGVSGKGGTAVRRGARTTTAAARRCTLSNAAGKGCYVRDASAPPPY